MATERTRSFFSNSGDLPDPDPEGFVSTELQMEETEAGAPGTPNTGVEGETVGTSSSTKMNEEESKNEVETVENNNEGPKVGVEGEIVSTSSSMELNEEESENDVETVENNIEEPKVGMMFDSLQQVYDHYMTYAKQKGFVVATKSVQKDIDGQMRYCTYACNRFGKSRRNSKRPLNPFLITKTKCQAKVSTSLWPNGKWRINSIVTDHNHVLSPGISRYYRCNRVPKPHIKMSLELNDTAGIGMNENLNSMVDEAGGYENLTFLEKDCGNHIEKVKRLRLEDGDATAVQNYFIKMQKNNSDFFYMIDQDEEGLLKNVFWADARSRVAFEEFGDVIMFDTMYLTNKYDMPFVPFVGINHHGQSILLGCGLISSEDTDTFTWLFRAWLTCMSERAPTAIITDEDRAIQNAIELVFPNARHRWCLWHIMEKLPEKLKGYKEYEGIKFALQNAVYDSLTSHEFEESWNWMIEKFRLGGNDWLIGLYNERRRWVPAFVKDSFWAGMSIIGRSESMTPFFDGYITSKTTLKQFVEQYENALRSKVEKENLADFNSFNSRVPCITHYDMEKQLQEAYTTAKFREFQHELTCMMYCHLSLVKEIGAISEYEVFEHIKAAERLKRLNFKVFLKRVESEKECEVKCSCRLFEFKGILCRHAISVLIHRDIDNIPANYVMQRWRKDLKRRHTKVKISYDDWSVKAEGSRFDKMCNAFQNTAHLAVDSEDKFKMVMDFIHDLDERLRRNEGICRNSQPSPRFNSDMYYGGGARHILEGPQYVFTPLPIRSKIPLPFKRKQSKVDEIVEKVKEKKKKTKSKGKKTSEQKGKDSHIIESGKNGNVEDQPLKEVVDVIPAQEGIIITGSQSTQNVHVDRYDGDHPSMLQSHSVPLHMGMPHLPLGMPRFPYGSPSFGPHQPNFGQGSQGYFAVDPNYASGDLNRSNTLYDSYSKTETNREKS